jgi:AsmA protein
MHKILKFLGWMCVISISLGIISAIALVALVNPNHYKQQISMQVQSSTGRDLQLNGNLAWSFFPSLGLQLNDATLSNPPGFSAQPFIHLDHAKVAVQLWPLLHKQIAVGTIKLDGATIYLVKNEKGVGNWENLTAQTDQATTDVSTNSATSKPVDFGIANIDISNGHIIWSDLQSKQLIDLNQVELHSKNIKLQQPFPVQLQFNLNDKKDNVQGTIHVKGILTADSNRKIYKFQQLQIDSQLNGPSLPNNHINLTAQGDFTTDLAQHLSHGNLQAKTLQLGDFTANNLNVQFKSMPGQIALNPIQAQLYQGDYQGKVFILTRDKTLRFSSYTELNKVQMQPLLHDLAKITYLQLSGVGNVRAKLDSQGNTSAAIIKNMNGDGNFSLNNGVLHGINISYWIDAGQAVLRKQLPSLPAFPQQTEFGTMTGTFAVNNGVLQNNDLILRGPNLRATGAGSANLNTQQINYQLNAQLLDRDTAAFKGSVIPIKITGSFSHPNVSPILKDLIKSQFKDQYEKHKDQIGNEIKKVLGNDTGSKVQQGLESFFH